MVESVCVHDLCIFYRNTVKRFYIKCKMDIVIVIYPNEKYESTCELVNYNWIRKCALFHSPTDLKYTEPELPSFFIF